MFFKLAVLACVALSQAQHWNGDGAWHSNSPHRNDPIPPGIAAPAQFPAGVNPNTCPNYPHCGNPSIALGAAADTQSPGGGWGHNNGGWNGGQNGGWNGGQNGGWNGGNNWNNNNGGWNGGQNSLDSGAYTGDGDYHGEGLQEAGAYGDVSQNWNDNNQQQSWQGNNQWNQGNNHQWNAGHQQAAQLPAGVDAHQCPNYPYCH